MPARKVPGPSPSLPPTFRRWWRRPPETLGVPKLWDRVKNKSGTSNSFRCYALVESDEAIGNNAVL